MKTFIVIPCYNESRNLASVISQAKKYGQVIVVDDASTDQSAEVANGLDVIVLKHLINRGQGAALQTGDSYALNNGADIVVHFDSDGQMKAEEIPLLTKPIIEGNADIVFGSRFRETKSQIPFFKKYFILKPAILLQNILLKSKLTDAHNGFRALSKKALQKISIKQDGMAHASEIVEQTIQHKLRYQEVPVTIIYNEFGQGFVGGLKILKDLIFGKFNK